MRSFACSAAGFSIGELKVEVWKLEIGIKTATERVIFGGVRGSGEKRSEPYFILQ